MHNGHRPARCVPALALAALAACTTQAPPDTAASPSPFPTNEPAATRTAAPPAPESTSLPCRTRADLAALQLEDIAAAPMVCFDAENGERTTIPQAELIEVIRAFLQDPARRVPSGIPFGMRSAMPNAIGFREMTFMGNSPSGVLPVARFEDDQGASYLVAVVAGKVLEMQTDPGPAPTGGDVLSPEQLQTIAEDLIRRELPEFDRLRDRLSFEAGAKSDGVNFFRWELATSANDGSMPPLAQVGITDSGMIFSYINTLYFLL